MVLEILATAIRQEKGLKIGKKWNLPLAEDKLNIENPKDSIKKLIKELSKGTGYKINI